MVYVAAAAGQVNGIAYFLERRNSTTLERLSLTCEVHAAAWFSNVKYSPTRRQFLGPSSRRYERETSRRLKLQCRASGSGSGNGSGKESENIVEAPASTNDRKQTSTAVEDTNANTGAANNTEEQLEQERKRVEKLQKELDAVEEKMKRQLKIMEREEGSSGLLGSFSTGFREGLEQLELSLGLRKTNLPAVAEKLDMSIIRKVCSQYSSTGFYMTEIRRYGNGAMVVGNIRCAREKESTKCLENILETTREKLSAATGVDLGVWFLIDSVTNQTVLVVQPLEEVQARLNATRLNGIQRWPLSLAMIVATCGTITTLSGVNLDPSGTQEDLLLHALPLAGGLWTVLVIGEMFQRIMAKRYNVRLSPSYPIPSSTLGCLGIATRIESFIPSRAALFDIAAARAVGGWMAALLLTTIALLLDGGVNGGSNPLYVEPSFFQPNLLISFIQYVIGPYYDDLGNVLPHAVPGVGVPVNPLAFGGLLGLVITSLNLMPAGQLEGGRIAQALLGRKRAQQLTTITTTGLAICGVFGSVLCLLWASIILLFRNGEELPALDEVSDVGKYRMVLGFILLGGCILMLLPNSAGTFPSTFFTPPSFFVDTL